MAFDQIERASESLRRPIVSESPVAWESFHRLPTATATEANTANRFLPDFTITNNSDSSALTRIPETTNVAAIDFSRKHPEQARDRASEQALSRLVDQTYSTPDLAARKTRFEQDMQTFESRAQSANLSPREISQTYDQIGRILTAAKDPGGSHPLPPDTLLAVASQVMHNAAEPDLIRQSPHSCGVTSMEFRTYSRTPSDAAKVVAEIATTGRFVAHNSARTVVSLDQQSLTPSAAGTTDLQKENVQRTFASQLFQLTAETIANAGTPGYTGAIARQLPVDNLKAGGEQIYVPNTNKLTNDEVGASHYDDGVLLAQRGITGRDEPQSLLVQVSQAGRHARMAENFADEAGFIAHIDRLKGTRQLPAIVAVHADAELFTGRPDAGRSSRDDGHFVAVTGYDERSRTFFYYDPYVSQENRAIQGVPANLFYRATFVPNPASHRESPAAQPEQSGADSKKP
jgi:hypothetical protein